MPAPTDILAFIRGQILSTPSLPNASFAGKTIVITGGNQGLGFECAKHLIARNASTIVLGCRDITKGEAAKEELDRIKGSSTIVQVWKVDMASYASVKQFAEKIRTDLPRIDVLLANAGISTNLYRKAEEYEQTLTVNVVSTFLLVLLCLPVLEQTAMRTGSPTHVTIVGSLVHCFADHEQLRRPPKGSVLRSLSEEKEADMAGRYFLSKLIVLLCVQEMAKRIPKMANTGGPAVILNCPNPGWCRTQLFRQDDGGAFARNLLKVIGRTPEQGARTLTDAIQSGVNSNGRYLSECQVKPASVWVRSAQGMEMQRDIWEELLGTLERISPGCSEVLV